MPKKANEQKAKARKLFEEDGLTLAEIAKQLDLKPATVRSWKKRDEWDDNATQRNGTKKKKKRKCCRNVSKKSIDNLIPVQPGEQVALKHGMYAKYLNPVAAEVYNSLDQTTEEDELTWLREAIKIKMANYVGGQKMLDPYDPKAVQAEAQAAKTLSNMIAEYKDLKAKIGSTAEDDDFIAALERSTTIIWGDQNEE